MEVIEMKTQDVIDLALASGLYQDGEMFFSPSTGEADVHISDLEYFAKLVKDRTLSKQKARYYQEGYEANQHDMSTKLQNVDTSEKCVHETDIFIHEIERLKDLNRRLVAAAKELGYADDTHEWDDAWSKLFAIITENVSDNNGKK
jgi:hypothetical protein